MCGERAEDSVSSNISNTLVNVDLVTISNIPSTITIAVSNPSAVSPLIPAQTFFQTMAFGFGLRKFEAD